MSPPPHRRTRFIACCLGPVVLLTLLAACLGGRAIYARLTAPARCGEAYVDELQGRVSQVPDGATACFLQAASRCAHKTLTVQIGGVDGYTEQELIIGASPWRVRDHRFVDRSRHLQHHSSQS
jgi:hypothetical protein